MTLLRLVQNCIVFSRSLLFYTLLLPCGTWHDADVADSCKAVAPRSVLNIQIQDGMYILHLLLHLEFS